MIAVGDGVLLVQDGVQGPGDGFAVCDVHAAVFVNVDPEEPIRSFPDVFHVPQPAAQTFHNGAGEAGYLLCDFHSKHAFLSKKERGAPLSFVSQP